MTEAELRSKIANWLVQYIGIKEGSSKHLAILKVFNDSKLCTRYTMTTKDHWCATSVSAAFIANKMAGAFGSGKLFECVECSCGNMIELAKKQGIWLEKDNYVPNIGDIIMYDWNDTGSGDNTGWPDHVGIVISVASDKKSFKVIEGNVDNTVGYRTMAVNGKYIRGFIIPSYSKFATKTTTTAKKESTTTTTTNKTTSSTTSSYTPKKTLKFKGVVIAKELNVRSWAGTENKVLRKLAKDTVVDVCDTIKDADGDDWYYIKHDSKYGFVSSDYIAKKANTTKKTTTTSTPNKTVKFKGKVTAKDGLNVRSWAGTENSILRTLAYGATVNVCDTIKASTGKAWYYIKHNNKYGFVAADYIARI